MIRVAIADLQDVLRLDKRRLRQLTRRVLADEGVSRAQISLAFLTDAAIHRLNKQFLEHDEPTDVITFPLSDPSASLLTAELVVSTETAKRTAETLGHAADDELALYVIHGLLHLCGYDDIDPKDRRVMRLRERHYLAALRIDLHRAE